MSMKHLDILVVAHAEQAERYSRPLKQVFPETQIRMEDSSGLVLQALEKSTPDVIFIDWSISTFDLADFCTTVRSRLNDSVCLLVAIVHNNLQSSRALSLDLDHVIDLQDERHADSILQLNCNLIKRFEESRIENRQLRATIRSKEAGEKQMLHAMERMIHVRFPDAADELPFLLHAVEWIVEQFRNEEGSELEKTQIFCATHLAWLGKMHLPDSERHSRITLDGSATNNFTAFVPLQADAILEGVDNLAGARLILKNMYENYDGTGFPDRKQHWQIPLGSRILRAVCDLDEIARTQRISMVDALEQLKRFNRHVYDHRVVALLEEYLLNVSRRSADHAETRAVQLFDLMEGMQLASDIVTNSGLKLMNAGTVLRDQLIRRIQSHNAMDPILGNIYVRES